jgi:hypothetical protein
MENLTQVNANGHGLFWGLQAGKLPVGCVRASVVVVVGEREREQGRRKKKDKKAYYKVCNGLPFVEGGWKSRIGFSRRRKRRRRRRIWGGGR